MYDCLLVIESREKLHIEFKRDRMIRKHRTNIRNPPQPLNILSFTLIHAHTNTSSHAHPIHTRALFNNRFTSNCNTTEKPSIHHTNTNSQLQYILLYLYFYFLFFSANLYVERNRITPLCVTTHNIFTSNFSLHFFYKKNHNGLNKAILLNSHRCRYSSYICVFIGLVNFSSLLSR